MWIYLNERYTVFMQSELEYVVVSWLNDGVKSMFYIFLELITITVRIMIYCSIRSIHKATVVDSSSAKGIKQQQEQRRVLKQMTLFTIPFLVCGIVLIVYRITDDVYDIVNYNSGAQQDVKYSTPVKVLVAIHSILFPLRGFLDALMYGLVSKWFMDACCGSCLFKCCQKKMRTVSPPEDDEPAPEEAEIEHNH